MKEFGEISWMVLSSWFIYFSFCGMQEQDWMCKFSCCIFQGYFLFQETLYKGLGAMWDGWMGRG
jgi:hypothetical protein